MIDASQLTSLGIIGCGSDYWLASPSSYTDGYYTSYYIDYISSNGSVMTTPSYPSSTSGAIMYGAEEGPSGLMIDSCTSQTKKLRPVFRLNNETKIVSGNGSSSSPYVLGL